MSRWAIGKFDALHLGHRALAAEADVLLRLSGLAAAFGWPQRPPLVADCDRGRILSAWGAREQVQDIAAIRDLDAAGVAAWRRWAAPPWWPARISAAGVDDRRGWPSCARLACR
jgi:hypothetical protein